MPRDRPAMTFEQLRIFVAVAEAEHMTRAAQALNLTQPAASAAIAALEGRYGAPLFHRVGRRIELTELGRLFLGEARAVLKRAAEAELALDDTLGLKRGALALHASQTIANYWLPPLLHRFRSRHPAIALNLAIGNTAQVAAAVRDGSADLGFVEGKVADEALQQVRIAGDELVLVVGAGHPWAKRATVAPRALVETPWVLREPGSGTRSEFAAALRRFGIDPDRLEVRLELPSNEAVRLAVEAGAGATVISRLVVEGALQRGALHRIPLDLPARPFFILRHRERFETRAAQAFLALALGEPEPAPGRKVVPPTRPS